MRIKGVQVCALVMLLILGAAAIGENLPAEDNAGHGQIIFLTLRADSTGISLVKSRSVEGTLKERRDLLLNGGIYYEVESRDGSVLAHGSVSNPLERRLEWEDPDEPGRLRRKLVNLQEADFVLRITERPDIESISFYRIDRSDRKMDVDRGDLVGRIKLNLEGEVER